MRAVRLSIILAVALAAGLGTTTFAFHSGGVAECGGCHSMHSPKAGGYALLVGTDASSACLTCHERAGDTAPSSYHISTPGTELGAGIPPKQRTPGGDFAWLKKDYTFTVRGSTTNEDGDTHGHNIIAVDNGYAVDGTNATAPGGTFVSSQLGCQSCHDPHGQGRRFPDGTFGTTGAPIVRSGSYDTSADPLAGEAVGIYRILAFPGYTRATGVTWGGWPVAVAPSTYNRTEATTQTRVAYGGTTTDTFGDWCGSCHGEMHSDSAAGKYVHPTEDSLGDLAAIYASYVKSGDLSGTAATSFLSLVPFQENTKDFGVLKSHAKNNDTQLGGPATADRVTCLSCHRAHASGWEYALRWNMEGEFMTYAGQWPGTDTTPTVPQFARGRLGAETQAAYYDRAATKFATYQRVLCNKCHAKD